MKIVGSGTTTIVISNKDMKDIRKIVKSPEDPGLITKVITKRIENETKEQMVGFLNLLLITRLLAYCEIYSQAKKWSGVGVIRASNGAKKEKVFYTFSFFD